MELVGLIGADRRRLDDDDSDPDDDDRVSDVVVPVDRRRLLRSPVKMAASSRSDLFFLFFEGG